MLIDGAYQEGLPSNIPWAGSGNQRLIHLNKGIVQRYNLDDAEPDNSFALEIIIDKAGAITATGQISSKELV
jgi:hypothetical protein